MSPPASTLNTLETRELITRRRACCTVGAVPGAFFVGFVLLAAACGTKPFESLCKAEVPPPAACNTACNPMPGAQNSCPGGYHCSGDGKCDLQCTTSGNECGNGY